MPSVAPRHFERLVCLAALCWSAAMLAFAVYDRTWGAGQARPMIATNPPVFDAPDSARMCSIVVRNLGQAPLLISRVQPGCGDCVEVRRFPTSPIEPSGKGFVELHIKANPQTAHTGGSVTIHSNDPVTPRLIVRVPPLAQSAESGSAR